MLKIASIPEKNCEGLHRREWLRIGGVSFSGMALSMLGSRPFPFADLRLADLIAAEDGTSSRSAVGEPQRALRPKSCILIYLAGGPSQLETFDPKPNAPANVRGPWGSIATPIAGVRFGEMLPQLARRAKLFSIVRTLNHTNSLHNPWPILTGNMQSRISVAAAITHLSRRARLRPKTDLARSESVVRAALPDHISIGAKLSIGAAELGVANDPLEIDDPLRVQESVQHFLLPQHMPAERFGERERLLKSVDSLRRRVDDAINVQSFDRQQQRAYSLLTSSVVRDAFDIGAEPSTLREQYGNNHFGRSCLFARRLVEAGTRLVQVNWANREDGFAVGWDVHGDDQTGLVRMEQQLCPRFDQGLATLLDDLNDRGLFESTLVVVTGEFGRTPTISRLGGRDHWPYCFSALFAGAGVPGGTIVGASDKHAAYPTDRPVSPTDFLSTIHHLLGLDANSDDRLRPSVFEARPISEFLTMS